MSKIEKQWISIEELSEYLGISAVTIRFLDPLGKGHPCCPYWPSMAFSDLGY